MSEQSETCDATTTVGEHELRCEAEPGHDDLHHATEAAYPGARVFNNHTWDDEGETTSQVTPEIVTSEKAPEL